MIEFVNGNLIIVSLAVIVIAAIAWVWSEKRRTRTLKSIISDEMAPKLLSSACGIRRIWRNILFSAAWVILAFCLLRPYSGVDIEERKQQTRDILVVFDVSNSMNVIDCYGESRMDYGRNLIRKLVKAYPSEKYGLMSFSGLAFNEIPLTTDAVSFDIALEGLKKHNIPLGGTNIQIALNQALKEFKEGAKHKAMILISDGEEIGGDYREAAEELKKNKVKLITVLAGDTRKAGTVRDVNDIPIRNRAGDVITSKADPKLLNELASVTGGEFINFDPNGNSYQQLNKLKAEIGSMASLEGESETIRKPREIYQPFLLVAIVLLLIRMYFGERRKSFNSVAALIAIFFSVHTVRAQQPAPQQEPQLSEEQKTELLNLKHEENVLLKNAEDENLDDKLRALAWYNLATNLTKQHFINPVEPVKSEKPQDTAQMADEPQPEQQGSLAKAEAAFDKAVSMAGKQKGIKSSALHNKGTLFQKEAQKIFLKEPDLALKYLDEATQLYRKALILNPGDIQIRKNLELNYIDITRAKIAKEIHDLHCEAEQHAGTALFSYRKLKDMTLRNQALSSAIKNETSHVKNKSSAIKEKLNELNIPLVKSLYDQVIEHTTLAESTMDIQTEESSTNTEKNLAEAYKLLGGNPDQEPDENQDQNNDSDNNDKNNDKNKDPQKKGENKKDPGKENKDEQNKNKDSEDKSEQSTNNGEQESSVDKKEVDTKSDGFFNKDNQQPQMSKEEKERRAKIQEAEALLRKLSDKEKEVREHIRERQAEMLRQEMRRKGISIPPEADK